MFIDRTRKSHWYAVFSLIGHLVGTAIIFIALITLGWLISYALHSLHAVHQFSNEIFAIITKFELYLTYLDIGLCSVVIVIAGWRFCKDILEGE